MTETKAVPTPLSELDQAELFTLAGDVFRRIKRTLSQRMDFEVDALNELSSLYEVARVLQSMCAALGDRPPRAEAILRAIEYGNVESAVHGDGTVCPPTRKAIIHGLTDMIEARERQLTDFVTKQVDAGIGAEFNTAPDVLSVAFRDVRRQRDAFVLARDYA